jgi:hypothetical protein
MPNRPLGIADLIHGVSDHDPDVRQLAGYLPWFWCRCHTQTVLSGSYCTCTCLRGANDWHNMPPGSVFHDQSCPQHPHNRDCIRVGPFMSEREANRLSDHVEFRDHLGRWLGPLGMEIES